MTANSLIDATLRETAQAYQHGALIWMKRYRPKEWERMIALEQRVNEMALESNLKGLREALDEYQGLILVMAREFKTIKEEKGQRMFKFVECPKSPWDG